MTTSYFLTAVSHHGSSDCLLYERYPIRRYLCRSAKITRRNSRLHHLQMETPDTDLHPARNDFLYDASASLLTILLFAKKERSHKLLSKFVTAFFLLCSNQYILPRKCKPIMPDPFLRHAKGHQFCVVFFIHDLF